MPSILPRARFELSNEEFHELMELTYPRPWLRKRSVAVTDLWQLCDSAEKKALFRELIENFRVLDFGEVEDLCGAIKDQIQRSWRLLPRRTLIIATSDDFEADGSQMALQFLKNQFEQEGGWGEKNLRNSLVGYDDYLKSGWTYVLLDDFVGSGKTMARKWAAFAKAIADRNLKNVGVKAVALAAMDHSIELLSQSGIDLFCPLWLKKGIDGHNDVEGAKTKRALMRQLEGNLLRRYDGQYLPGLGHGGAQALYSLGGSNCPNNVFPIFWWPKYADSSRRNTILRRLR